MTDASLYVRSLGSVPAVMLFVDFADVPRTMSPETMFGYHNAGVTEWFAEASYGQLDLTYEPVLTWYRMPRAMADYWPRTPGANFDKEGYLRDAVELADDDVDFSQYEFVTIARPFGNVTFPGTVLSLPAGTGVPADGVTVRQGVFLSSNNRPGDLGISTIHETAHIFGLPDLYDEQGAGPIHAGMWDIMSWEPGRSRFFFAWHAVKLGWITGDQLVCIEKGEVEANLSPIESGPEGTKAILVKTSSTSAYVIEARSQLGGAFCRSGVLIYTVDSSVRTGRGPIRLKPAGEGPNSSSRSRCGDLYDAPFDVGSGLTAVYDDDSLGLHVEIVDKTEETYSVRVIRR